MTKSIFSKISPSALTKEAKSPHKFSEDERLLVDVCGLSGQDALLHLNSNIKGLSTEESEKRLDEYGPNELAHTKTIGFWTDIFNRCRSPLVIQLLIIALVSVFIGEIKSTIIVSVMVLLSVGLSYILDRRSSNAVKSLGKRVQSHVLLIRDGKEIELPISEVVSGDIVVLQCRFYYPCRFKINYSKGFLRKSISAYWGIDAD